MVTSNDSTSATRRSSRMFEASTNPPGYGAFNDMRAIVVAEKNEPTTNVIEAGGDVVINVTLPFDDSIHATYCLLEMKMVQDFSKYVPLAQQGIKCVNIVYISDFLCRNKKAESDYIHNCLFYKILVYINLFKF